MRRFLVKVFEWRLERIGWVDDRHGLLPEPSRIGEWNFYVRMLRWLCDD